MSELKTPTMMKINYIASILLLLLVFILATMFLL